MLFLPIHIVVDGSDMFSTKADAVKEGFGSTISGTVFNLVLPDEVMRNVANGTQVWVTIPQFGEQRQVATQLGTQQLATFKLIVDAYDRITTETSGRSDK